jgi:hypothetical protein
VRYRPAPLLSNARRGNAVPAVTPTTRAALIRRGFILEGITVT